MSITDPSQFPTPIPESSAVLRCRCWNPDTYREEMLRRQLEPEGEEAFSFWAEAGCVADEQQQKLSATSTISRRLSLPAPTGSKGNLISNKESSAGLGYQNTPLTAAIRS